MFPVCECNSSVTMYKLLTRSPKFYLTRLKETSVHEIIDRAGRVFLAVGLRVLSRFPKLSIGVLEVGPESVASLAIPYFHIDMDEETIGRVFSGEVITLGPSQDSMASFEKESRDLFFTSIRVPRGPIDIRAVWEPARLQHVTLLLLSSMDCPDGGGSKIGKATATDVTLRWIQENRFLFGPHYMSAMECALRIPVFFYVLKGADAGSKAYSILLETIYVHGWWISKNLSLNSSLGNHTICEAVGLIFAGAIFKNTPEGADWLKTGIRLLREELKHQVLDDGGPAEQSLNYHRFVLDLYWLGLDFLETNRLCECGDLRTRLIQGEHFLRCFQTRRGSLPQIGDSDDGQAIAPGVSPKRGTPQIGPVEIQVFRTSGYTVIHTPNNVAFSFDHGPLGMSPFYNHGHADALSITLSKDGESLLVDPGTYRYNGESQFRKYFKGTSAHNTVTVDGLDQAVQETGFIWSRPYCTVLLKSTPFNQGWISEAEHNGYARLKKPVWHKRVVLYFGGENFLIKDTFSGEGIHDFGLNYHLHPDASVDRADAWWRISKGDSIIFLTLCSDGDFQLTAGRDDPLLGWFSPAYGVKRKSGVLHCVSRGPCREVVFLTAICTRVMVDQTELEKIACHI